MYVPKTPSSCLAVIIFFLSAQVTAFWRMPCLTRTGLARIDPLVSFGSVAEHAHYIHGSSGFSETATYDELIAGDCTSCQVSQDKSAYWTPALYFEDADTGEFTLVEQEGGMLAYYLIQTDPNNLTEKIWGFPQGFEMIAGDTNQRNFTYPIPDIEKSLWTGEYADQKFLRQAALGFNCLNYGAPAEPSLFRHFMPDKEYIDANCKNGVRLELMFPSCWNGAATPDDKKSHVAYPSQVMTGTCPPGFPKRLLSLFYETIVRPDAFPGRNGRFVFANGDVSGFGYHGDFIMGWNETFLQKASDQCRNPSGKIEDCPLFDIQTADVYSNCKIKEPQALLSEKVAGSLKSLPGNVAIKLGPGYAKGASPENKSPVSSSPAPIATPIESAPSPSGTEPSGGVFQVAAISESSEPAPVPVASSSVEPVPEPAPTPAPVSVEAAPVPEKSFFSTEYKTSGLTVNEILWLEEVVTVTQGYTATTTTTAAVQARNMNKHLHRHRGVGH